MQKERKYLTLIIPSPKEEVGHPGIHMQLDRDFACNDKYGKIMVKALEEK